MENTNNQNSNPEQQLDTVLTKIIEGDVILTLKEIKHDDEMKITGQITLSENTISSTTNRVYLMNDFACFDFAIDKDKRNDLLKMKSLLEMHRGKYTQATRKNENKVYDLSFILCKWEEDVVYRLEANRPVIFVLDDSDPNNSVLRVLFETKTVEFGIQGVDKYKVEEDYQYWVASQEEEIRDQLREASDTEDDTGYEE